MEKRGEKGEVKGTEEGEVNRNGKKEMGTEMEREKEKRKGKKIPEKHREREAELERYRQKQ